MASDDGRKPPEDPEYKVYRSRRGLRARLGSGDLSSLRERARRALPGRRASGGEPPPGAVLEPGRVHPGRRRWLRWLALVPVVWILISFIAFAISSQLQSSKLDGSVSAILGGNPFLLASPQTILVIGTDARDPSTKEPGAETRQRCIDQGADGAPPSGGCTPFRGDSLLLVRAGGGQFRKLSIPRDTGVDLRGAREKVNAAYAFGGAKLQVQTVERLLGIKIDHVVIIDFQGFEDFINAIGGVEINLPHKLCADIAGGSGGGQGGITLHLKKGDNTLDGAKALAYSRIRELSTCPGKGKSRIAFGRYDDRERAAAQQRVLNGIKSRLTSPLRLPYNFLKGPIIGWTAPQAFVSDMGALSMPQLILSTAIAGSGDTDVLCGQESSPCSINSDGTFDVPESEIHRAVKALTG